MREASFIQWLQQQAHVSGPAIRRAIGDDAAVLRFQEQETVVTTDLLAEDTHFSRDECTLQDVGRKAIAVNLSDIAAMAASPVAAFVSLLLPSEMSEAESQELMLGIIRLANEFHCPVVGGDTNVWHGKLVVSVTVIGSTARTPLSRHGAQAGDRILVTGALGGSREGHHYQFRPRVDEAIALHDRYCLHAGMDLSDGLALDLRRMCEASGCGAEVVAVRLPISQVAAGRSRSPAEAQRSALGDGEDFELLLAAPEEEAERMLRDQPLDVPISDVGHFHAGDELWLVTDGQRCPMPTLGFEHKTSAESSDHAT